MLREGLLQSLIRDTPLLENSGSTGGRCRHRLCVGRRRLEQRDCASTSRSRRFRQTSVKAPSTNSGEGGQEKRPGLLEAPASYSERGSTRFVLGGYYRPWSRELRGIACRACGRRGDGPSQRHPLGGGEGEGDVAAPVGFDGLLSYEDLALVGTRGVGEELHHEGPVGAAV